MNPPSPRWQIINEICVLIFKFLAFLTTSWHLPHPGDAAMLERNFPGGEARELGFTVKRWHDHLTRRGCDLMSVKQTINNLQRLDDTLGKLIGHGLWLRLVLGSEWGGPAQGGPGPGPCDVRLGRRLVAAGGPRHSHHGSLWGLRHLQSRPPDPIHKS